MSSFRKPITVVGRKASGSYGDDGNYVDGAQGGNFTIMASVQPAPRKALQALPEGERTSAAYLLYTDTLLLISNPTTGRGSDFVVIDGETYKVAGCAPWQNNVIPHYEILVTKENQ